MNYFVLLLEMHVEPITFTITITQNITKAYFSVRNSPGKVTCCKAITITTHTITITITITITGISRSLLLLLLLLTPQKLRYYYYCYYY